MQESILFKDCKFLFALPEHGGITTGLSVLTQGNTIRQTGTCAVLTQAYPQLMRNATVVDCSNKIVMPGLVDGHNHLCNTHMNLSRIFSLNYNDIAAHMMATIHDPYGWMTDEALYDISLAGALCDLKQGATTIENSTIKPDVAYRAMRDSGARGILAPQMATAFRLENDDLNWKQMLERTAQNIRDYHNPADGMSVVVHVHDLWDTLEEVMVQGLAMAEKYDTQYVTHFWEFKNAVGMPTSETVIDGKFVRKNGNFMQLDEEAVVGKAAAWCERFIPDLAARLKEDRHYARYIHSDFARDDTLDLEALLYL